LHPSHTRKKGKEEDVCLVLRLRLNKRVEELVEQAFGGVESFQAYLNEHSSWMYQQQEVKYLNGKRIPLRTSTILLCERVKLVLSPPVIAEANNGKDLAYFNRVFAVLQPNRNDRADALAGREVQEPIEIEFDVPIRPERSTPTTTVTVPKPAVEKVEEETKPKVPAAPQPSEDRQRFLINPVCPKCSTVLTPGRGLFCQGCGVRLPAELAVHPEIVVVIVRKEYDQLAIPVKQSVNAAWTRFMKGRKVSRTLRSMGQNIFLMTIEDEWRASSENTEQELDRIIVDAGIGRTTTDPYELKEAHKMLEQSKSTN
jgi:hypothetical protein